MAERASGQERTEAPSQRRREEARREGRIPRSQELSGAAVLLAGAVALATAGGTALSTFVRTLLAEGAGWIAAGPLDQPAAIGLLREVTRRALSAFAPFALALAGVVLAVNLIQARGVISLEPVAVKWSRLDPLAGIGRILDVQSLFGLLKSLLKLAILAWIASRVLASAWPSILTLPDRGPTAILLVMRGTALRLAVMTGLAFLALAGADYLFQLRQFEQSLKMTRQEVVQEHRESEGDPLIKSRIRAVARALSRRQMLRTVATADVVVTNPVHLAVALRYDVTEASAPVVLAMGALKLAERIKAIAADSGVPIVENQPLAQALFATATVGRPVPAALYLAVAEVLAFVYRRRGGRPSARAGLPAGGAS